MKKRKDITRVIEDKEIIVNLQFHVVMSIMISALKRCSVRLYLQLFVGAHVLFTLFVFVCVSNKYCVVFLLCLSSSFVTYDQMPVSLDHPFLIAPSVFSNIYLQRKC